MNVWKKHDAAMHPCDVVARNTGMDLERFLYPEPEPFLAGLDTAVSVVKGYLDSCGGKGLQVHIPRRFSEGYGLSMSIVDRILAASAGYSLLVITVDNGISAVAGIGTVADVMPITGDNLPLCVKTSVT